MTQEETDLLLKDLCARLPYGVKVAYLASTYDVDYIESKFDEIKLKNLDYTIALGNVKPYLRPMSSMTEEEEEIYNLFINCIATNECGSWELVDWLNSNQFDYHGLIPKGIALEAPEGMYKL
jgi:hypothetical protein